MSILEQLGIQTQGLTETLHPFELWEGSCIKNWAVTMQMLSIGDLADIGKLTENASSMAAAYLTKVYLLAKSVKDINGRELVTAEELEDYNRSHNLSGNNAITLFEYKVLFIRKLSEAVVTRLSFLYDEMQNKYISQLLGKPLPDELDATKFGADLSTEEPMSNSGKETETTSDEANNSTTTT